MGRGIRRLRVGGVATLERDATKSMEEVATDGGPFDKILIDAPCSGLGSMRRNPDARWRLRPEALEELARIQREILEAAAAVLRPGGSLVYSTCTVTPEENEAVVRGFMATRANWRIDGRDEAPETLRELIDEDGFFRVLPHMPNRPDLAGAHVPTQDMDGFFAVRIVRNPKKD